MSRPVRTVLLAGDVGPGAGLGHQRRLETIAGALRAQGYEAIVMPTGDFIDAPVVVVDSYHSRADDHDHYRAELLVALDDLDRDLRVDLLVDPSPGSDGSQHHAAKRVLAGAAYALVDPSLAQLQGRPVDAAVERVLVTTGAADGAGAGALVAGRLAKARPALTVRLALGPWGSREVPPGVEAFVARDGLADELLAADLVVTAGGVALLESLCLGRPTVAMVLAENQRRNVDGAASAGAAIPTDLNGATDAALALLDDKSGRDALSRCGRALIDGRGAERVADVIASALGTAK